MEEVKKYKYKYKDLENGWFSIIEEGFKEKAKEGCYFCGYDKILVPHHIIRKCDGGLNTDNNLINICPNCHGLIHTYRFFLGYSNGIFYLINRFNKEDKIFRKDAPYKDLPFGSISSAIDTGKLIRTKRGYKLAKNNWSKVKRIR